MAQPTFNRIIFSCCFRDRRWCVFGKHNGLIAVLPFSTDEDPWSGRVLPHEECVFFSLKVATLSINLFLILYNSYHLEVCSHLTEPNLGTRLFSIVPILVYSQFQDPIIGLARSRTLPFLSKFNCAALIDFFLDNWSLLIKWIPPRIYPRVSDSWNERLWPLGPRACSWQTSWSSRQPKKTK